MKNIIILAPHVDDEMIGCYKYLITHKIGKVIYFFDLSEERKQEAINLCKSLDVEFDFSGFDAIIPNDLILFVPSSSDSHPHHKAVNGFAKSLPNKKYYYSVDMVRPELLISPLRDAKKHDLISSYPSQKNLFLSNDKYYLFEKVSEYDSTIFLKVKTSLEGFHKYDDAPDDVAFLRNEHRHMFHIICFVEQFHDNRDIEYIQFKRWLEQSIKPIINNKSCEQIALSIKDIINAKYGYDRKVNVEVIEDNENGALITGVY